MTIQSDHNKRVSAREVAAFKRGSVKPGKSYLAYLSRDESEANPGYVTYRITTWTGETLANVTAIKSRKEMNSYFTDRRGSFWARGIDGRLYYGTHNGHGMYCRMRLSKRQTP